MNAGSHLVGGSSPSRLTHSKLGRRGARPSRASPAVWSLNELRYTHPHLRPASAEAGFSSPEDRMASAVARKRTMPDISEFMTTQEAAAYLGYSAKSIQNMLRNGKLKGRRMGGRLWLVLRKSVEEYKKNSEGMSKNDPRRGDIAS